MTLERYLRLAAAQLSQSPTPHLDVRVLAKHALALDDAALLAKGAEPLSTEMTKALDAMMTRRAREEPVAHIIGRREFWSLDIEVEPGILVPRTDSEALIEAAVKRRDAAASLMILDLGCGSGALLCALLSAFPAAEGLGVDLNPDAVVLTARNLERFGFASRARAQQSDWFTGVDARFDVIVSNPPYIRTIDRDTLPREVRDYEDARALFAGEHGLDAYRRIMAGLRERLADGGLAVFEFGAGQEDAIKELARKALPEAKISIEADLAGLPRAFVIDLGPAAN